MPSKIHICFTFNNFDLLERYFVSLPSRKGVKSAWKFFNQHSEKIKVHIVASVGAHLYTLVICMGQKPIFGEQRNMYSIPKMFLKSFNICFSGP